MTAAARRGYVNFFVEYGGKAKRCRVTETALLNRARVSKEDTSSAQLIAIFVKHRAEIEHSLPRSCSGRVTLTGASWWPMRT